MRYTGAKCRLCRREGLKLFLKGDRCQTQKCSVLRKNYAPGLHGKLLGKKSEYARQLREKQKAKRIFSITERQLKNYFLKANRMKGDKGQNLLRLRNLRLDNIIHVCGFAASRSLARQLVSHNYFEINKKRANIPSMQLKKGDKISLKGKKENPHLFEHLKKGKIQVPRWLKIDPKVVSCEVVENPEGPDLEISVDPLLIVEFYSR